MDIADHLGDPDLVATTLGPYASWRFISGHGREPAIDDRADELAPSMRKLRAMAPEFYGNLKYHSSWSRLLFQFIFDKRYSLYSRVERMKQRESASPKAMDVTANEPGNLDLSARPISF